MPHEIRICRREDFATIVPLLEQLWPDQRLDHLALQAVFERGFASGLQTYLCATADDRTVGFGSMTINNNLWQAGYVAHIDELVVDQSHRGQGIGAALLDRLVEIARINGCRRIELDSGFPSKGGASVLRATGL